MRDRARVRELSGGDAGYIAGLIDGEGSISLARKHAGENRQLVITISNTERSILEYVLRAIGSGKITRKRTSQIHHRPGLTFTITNRQALRLLARIHPYLRSYKRERSALVPSNYLALTPRNGKYSSELASARAAFEEEFLGLTNRVRDGIGEYLAIRPVRMAGPSPAR